MRWLEELLDLVFPPRPVCPLCGQDSAGAQICTPCRKKLAEYRNGAHCFCCGRFPVAPAGPGWRKSKEGKILCPECFQGEHYFTLARSAGPYEGALKWAIHRFKFGKKRFLARSLGALLSEVVKEIILLNQKNTFPLPEVAGLVPVPLARARLQERGFNQSVLLAREVAALTGLPVFTLLQKVHETPSQTGLSRERRKINLRGAFALSSLPENLVASFAGRSVFLIDDVFTTGFTADECARVLRQAGIQEVYVATLAGARHVLPA